MTFLIHNKVLCNHVITIQLIVLKDGTHNSLFSVLFSEAYYRYFYF